MSNFAPHFVFPDVSHWRPVVDWSAFLTYPVVACKATQGTGNVDPTWHEVRNRALAKNIPVIAYHFLERHDAPAQAKHFIAHAGLGNPLVVPALDVELYQGDYPTADEVREWWMEVYGKFPDRKGKGFIYVGAPQWNRNVIGDKMGLGSGYTHLWLPNWGNTSDSRLSPATGWSMIAARQYTDSEKIRGVVQPGDMNRYNGTPTTFRQRHLPPGASMGSEWTAPNWPGRVLKRGDNHPAIAWVQGLFNMWEIKDQFATNELGVFGPKTEATVKEFQRLIGAPQSGELDQTTWHRIVNRFRGDETEVIPPQPAPQLPSKSGDTVVFEGDWGLTETDRDWMRKLEVDTREYLKQVVMDAEERLGQWMTTKFEEMEERVANQIPPPQPAIRHEEFTDDPTG